MEVQLYDYENPLNLEHHHENVLDRPFCCCDNSNLCSNTLSDAPTSCPQDCDLVFTVCINVSDASSISPQCYQSVTLMDSPSTVSFSNEASLFPSQPSQVKIKFSLQLLTDIQVNELHHEDIHLFAIGSDMCR